MAYGRQALGLTPPPDAIRAYASARKAQGASEDTIVRELVNGAGPCAPGDAGVITCTQPAIIEAVRAAHGGGRSLLLWGVLAIGGIALLSSRRRR